MWLPYSTFPWFKIPQVSALVGSTKIPPGQVLFGQDQQYTLEGTKSVTTTQLQLPPPNKTYSYHHHIPLSHTTTTYKHHHSTTTTQCKLHECKWSICTSWWKAKHHQPKLLKVSTSIGASRSGLHQQHATTTTTTIIQIMTSMGAIRVAEAYKAKLCGPFMHVSKLPPALHNNTGNWNLWRHIHARFWALLVLIWGYLQARFEEDGRNGSKALGRLMKGLEDGRKHAQLLSAVLCMSLEWVGS